MKLPRPVQIQTVELLRTFLDRLVVAIALDLERKEPLFVGLRFDAAGPTIHVRFLSRTDWVQVHVQSTAAGEGDSDYDTVNFTSSDEIDCRESRLQDRTITPAPGERYTIYLIPVEKDPSGTILSDGEGGRPDRMSYRDVEV